MTERSDPWGQAPTRGQVLRAAARARDARARALTALLRDCLSVEQTAARLATDPAQVRERVRDGELVAIEHDGSWWLPNWQFDHIQPCAGWERCWPNTEGPRCRFLPGRPARTRTSPGRRPLTRCAEAEPRTSLRSFAPTVPGATDDAHGPLQR